MKSMRYKTFALIGASAHFELYKDNRIEDQPYHFISAFRSAHFSKREG